MKQSANEDQKVTKGVTAMAPNHQIDPIERNFLIQIKALLTIERNSHAPLF